MYCPNCGQQQVSDSTRFCSRCGLSIGGLLEWLASGGVPAVKEEEAPPALVSPRQKGISRGAKLMFVSGVLMPVFFGLGILINGPSPLIIPFTIFLAGLAMLLYARIFVEEITPAKNRQAQPNELGTTLGGNALPPASHAGMNSVGGKQARTTELVQPPSVTERTTKLLNRE